jgi:hypothetical protein
MASEPQGVMPFERQKVRRCGARAKSTGKACLQFATGNGRCFWHGGRATGPRTAEGMERSRKANWKHGRFGAEQKAARREAQQLIKAFREFANQIGV